MKEGSKLTGKGGAGRGQGRKKKEGGKLNIRLSKDVGELVEAHLGHEDKTSYVEAAVRMYGAKK